MLSFKKIIRRSVLPLFLALLFLPTTSPVLSGSRFTSSTACDILLANLSDSGLRQALENFPLPPPTLTFVTQTPASIGRGPVWNSGKMSIMNINGEDFTVEEQTFEVPNFGRRNLPAGSPPEPERIPFTVPAKDPKHLRSIAEQIKKNQAGIIALHEVIGGDKIALRANAEKFSRDYLNNDYMVLGITGNDPFGKNSIFLVNKRLPFRMEFQSRVNYRLETEIAPYRIGRKVFSRSHDVVLFTQPGKTKPDLIVAINHNKSKHLPTEPWRRSRPDADGTLLRQIQGNYDAAILLNLQKQYPGTPIVDIGDRNDNVDTAPAYQGLRTFLTNAFDIFNVPATARNTDFFYDHQTQQIVYSPIDSAMVNDAAKKPGLLLGVRTVNYTDDRGNVLVPAQTEPKPGTIKTMPSDHTPVVLDVDLGVLLK